MRILPTLAVAAVAVSLVGCSSTPTPVAERRSVQASSILAPELLRPSADRTCRVTLTRDRGFVAGGVSITAFLDGKPVARLGTGDSIAIYAAPGRHYLGARYRWGIGDAPAERECTLTAGQPTSWRLTVDNDGNLDIKAQSELLPE